MIPVLPLLALMACPPPDDPLAACVEEPPRVELGTGEVTHQPLSDGDSLTIVHGPQGGWHLLGSARVHHTSPYVHIHFTVTEPDSGTVVSDNNYFVALVDHADCYGDYPGMLGFLDVAALAEGEADTPPEVLHGHDLVMRLAIEDDEGRAASAEVTVTAMQEPSDVE